MRPLKLAVEGINSFVEEREVNFESLSQDGIFCICGPTGSGKTTILDCMILALYGENKNRGNLVDYINTKCDKGKISFDFAADGARYRIYRELRRKGSTAAKLTKIDTGEVIADRADTVTEEVKKMLKLEKDEFTKVVILEQGKFAQFMQMGGKDRSKTVSKLFSLEKYERLKKIFADGVRKYDAEIGKVNSALEQYADVTEEKHKEKEREIKRLKKESEEKKTAIVETEKSVKAGEKLLESAKRRAEAEKAVADAQAELASAATERQNLESQKTALARDKTELDALKERADIARVDINKADECAADEQDKAKKVAERDGLRASLIYANATIAELDEAIKSISAEKESNLSIAASIMRDIAPLGYGVKECAEAEFAAVQATAESDYKNLTAAEDKLGKAQENFKAAEELGAKLLARKTDSEREIAQLRKLSEQAASEYEHARVASEAASVRLSLKSGDTCPVCGGKYCGYNADEYSDANTLAVLKEASEKAKKTLEDATAALGGLDAEISVNAEKLKSAQKAADDQKELLATKSAANAERAAALARDGTSAAKKTREAEKEYVEKSGKLETERAKADKIISDGKKLTKDIEDIEKKISDRLGERTAEEVKAAAKKTIAEHESAQKAYDRKSQELSASETALAARESAAGEKLKANKSVLASLPCEPFDSEAYDKLCERFELLKAESEATVGNIAKLAAEAESMRAGLDKKKELAAKKSELKKTLDAISELNACTKGDNDLLAYVAEEYVQSFTAAASETLSRLTSGKYTLVYDDGEFYVEDFFADNVRRKVKTLSGGETFLASVSIAMAISREIALTQNYEFFFLDEGFGTLDERAIEMVTEALVSLSRETVVGVITHRSELAERIGAQLRVIPATEEKGSDVVNVGV